MESTNEAYLLTGGNLGDRKANLQAAAKHISKYLGNIIAQSSLYETEAWGVADQPPYLNQVLVIQTRLSAPDLLTALLNLEIRMGRKRVQKNDARTLDVDILFYNNLVVKTEFMTLPHPRLHLRRFVLVPLQEVAPKKMHPVLGLSITQLLASCNDPLSVQKFS